MSKQPSRKDKEIGQTFDILKENCWQAFDDWSPTFLYSDSMHIKFYITMQFWWIIEISEPDHMKEISVWSIFSLSTRRF